MIAARRRHLRIVGPLTRDAERLAVEHARARRRLQLQMWGVLVGIVAFYALVGAVLWVMG